MHYTGICVNCRLEGKAAEHTRYNVLQLEDDRFLIAHDISERMRVENELGIANRQLERQNRQTVNL